MEIRFLVLSIIFLLCLSPVFAVNGATILSNSTETSTSANPGNLTNPRSTINTITLNSLQQDGHWKAYVGNVTGTLTLDDAVGNTIYDWSNLGAPNGEVYSSRFNNLDFSSVQCAQTSTINNEMTFNNMTGSDVDSINNTFNYTAHKQIWVGAQSITADSCPSTALYVNDAKVAVSSSSDFQEVLLEDNGGQFFYIAPINDNTIGFDGGTYDFQMIVGESDVKSAPTTYYFYLEIS